MHMVRDASVSSSDVLAKLVGHTAQGLMLQDPSLQIELAVVSELTRSDDTGALAGVGDSGASLGSKYLDS